MDVLNNLHNFRRRRAAARKGSMLVLVCVATVILMVAAVFSVNLAYMFLAREQIHVATDAAAKAAVTGLSQGNSTTTAINSAIACAGSNTVCGQPLTITADNVTLGGVTYASSSGGSWAFTPGTTIKTAAQVSATATVPLFFGRQLNTASFSPTRSSTAAFVRNKWCFVFDRSGSMCYDMSGVNSSYPTSTKKDPTGYYYPPSPNGSRWSYLCAAANVFLTAVSASPVQNQVGMVTFSDSATADCTFSTNYTPITTALTNYGNNPMIGSTNLYSGLQAAINLFASTDDGTPWNKVIIVLSDGQWNEGSDPITLVTSLNNKGIMVHTVGLLSQGNNSTMQNLASQTGGQFYYATSGDALKQAFQKLALTIPVILTQ